MPGRRASLTALLGAGLSAALFAVPACRKRRAADGPLLQGLLVVAAEQADQPFDPGVVRLELERIAARVTAAQGSGLDVVAALRRVVFDQLAYVREVDRTDLRYVLLPSVVAGRRGSCVGLGTLYLVLAEQLGLPLDGILVPGHFFVRARTAAGVRNVELLRDGNVTDDDFYHQRYPMAQPPAPAYLRALTVPEILAVAWFNSGNERRRQGRLAEAERLYRRAAAGFPDFAEAHASVGLTLHLTGRSAEARQAYAAARRVQPDLPGLARNIELLGGEVDAGPRQARPEAAGNWDLAPANLGRRLARPGGPRL